MRSRLLPCLLLTLGSTTASTAQEYSVATLADSLRQNAQAVVRLYETDFQYNSPSSATARHDIVVTLLDRRGARHADLVCYVDMFSSLKSFSAEICDASGRVIRKLGKGDLNYTEYSQHLADDAAYYWLEPPLSVFPCTVRYRYETAHKNGMFGTLRFVPLSTDIGVALEKARFRLSTPAGYAFNCRCTPFPVEPVRHTDRGRDNYEWTFPSRTAVLDEPLIPPARERLPILYFAPSEFTYDKTQGNMQDWPRFGVWMDGLLAGRGQLPPALQAEIHDLTDTIPDKRRKIEALYRYLGRTTRYVSIQSMRINSATARRSPTTCTRCWPPATSSRSTPSSTRRTSISRAISPHRPSPTTPFWACRASGTRCGWNAPTPTFPSAMYISRSPVTTP